MSIDWWTLGLQTVNVAVLVWLLARFFWRPVAAMVAHRQAVAQKLLADAEASRVGAEVAKDEIEKTRAGFAQERTAILAAAEAAAAKLRGQRLAEANNAIEARRAAATADLDKQRAEADAAWTERANRLAVEIATRLAGRLDGPAVEAAFKGWLLAAIKALPEAARSSLVDPDRPLTAVSATPLGEESQRQFTEALTKALGGHPTIAFATDAGLIAGLELHGPDLVIANSWRADLDRILADMNDAKR